MESGLAQFLNAIIGGGSSWKGHDLYYSKPNLNPRLGGVQTELRDLITREPHIRAVWSRWRKLKAQIEAEARDRRNLVIHGQFVQFQDMATLTVRTRIVPYFGSYERRPDPADLAGTFDVPDIHEAEDAANKLWEATQALSGYLSAIGNEAAEKMFTDRFDNLLKDARTSLQLADPNSGQPVNQ